MTAASLSQLLQRKQRVETRLKRLERQRAEILDLALIRAAEDGDLRAVREQLEAGARPNARNRDGEPVLFLAACRKGNLPIVRELLKAGAKVDETDESRNTALIVSARDEQLPVVKELIKHGANVNARNLEGDTPLTNAACWGSRQVVKYLLSHSADPHQPDGLNVSAADLARQHGHDEIADLLERSCG